MKKYTHLFFDLDHTLWDFERNSGQALEKIYDNFDLAADNIDLTLFQANFSKINKHYWQLLDAKQITHQILREKRFAETMNAVGKPISTEVGLAMNEAFLQFLPIGKNLIDGAVEILDVLVNHYELHLITNGYYEVQKRKIDNSGIGQYFKTMATNDVADALKPDPKIFQKGLELANATLENSLMIGDNFESDVLGALNFGMDVVFFNPDKIDGQGKATFEISKLTDILPILV